MGLLGRLLNCGGADRGNWSTRNSEKSIRRDRRRKKGNKASCYEPPVLGPTVCLNLHKYKLVFLFSSQPFCFDRKVLQLRFDEAGPRLGRCITNQPLRGPSPIPIGCISSRNHECGQSDPGTYYADRFPDVHVFSRLSTIVTGADVIYEEGMQGSIRKQPYRA